MAHFFISYCKKDTRELATALADALNTRETSAWVDTTSLHTSASWERQIQSEIDKCDYFVVLYSPDINRHERGLEDSYVLTEIAYAKYSRKKPVIPIMAELTQAPLSLTTYQYIDYAGGMSLEELVARIMEEASKLNMALLPKSMSNSMLRRFNVNEAIKHFYAASDSEDWEEAERILSEIRSSGQAPAFFNIDEEAKPVLEGLKHKTAKRDYDVLQVMASRPNPKGIWEALLSIWQRYPYYDPENLARFMPKPDVSKLLPAPFDWAYIPAGKVNIEAAKESYIPEGKPQPFDVQAFYIAKYPVTNAQFACFIEGGGYRKKRYWTHEGWAHEWKEPRYWDDKNLNVPEQPVVGVSWFEAQAFCNWLNEALEGSKQKALPTIMLPTEQQWQRAAQGDDKRKFPWGNDFDASKTNSYESGKGKSSPVNAYPDGASPFGVMDMGGNVWEWCLTDFTTGSNDNKSEEAYRVLRGGSYSNMSNFARVGSRYNFNQNYGFNNYGFRICAVAILP